MPLVQSYLQTVPFDIRQRASTTNRLNERLVSGQREAELRAIVGNAISELIAANKTVTKTAIEKATKKSIPTLMRYPRVALIIEKAIADELTTERIADRKGRVEAVLRDAVVEAVRVLEADEEPLTQEKLAARTGRGLYTLRRYSSIRSLLENFPRK
jgi:hypothetical protein